MEIYYYVSKIGGGKPSFKHSSFDDAVREAQRLIDTIGGEYEILESRAVVKAAPKYIVDAPRQTGFSATTAAPYGGNSRDEDYLPF